MARQQLADLFLDTLPCNAHTTASDALRGGVPVLTCAGNKFAGRVAGSLLNAVGLPELVTGAREEYEELALRLARDPERLQDLEEKIARNRLTAPLFNSARHTRDLECAFQEMVRLYRNGAAPRNISVADIT